MRETQSGYPTALLLSRGEDCLLLGVILLSVARDEPRHQLTVRAQSHRSSEN